MSSAQGKKVNNSAAGNLLFKGDILESRALGGGETDE